MAISLTDKLLPYTVHISSGHYFQVLVPFETLGELSSEVKRLSTEAEHFECVCLNINKKAFFRFIKAESIVSIDDDQVRVETSLEDLDMDAKDKRTRNAQKKSKKSLDGAKNKLSKQARERKF